MPRKNDTPEEEVSDEAQMQVITIEQLIDYKLNKLLEGQEKIIEKL